MVELIALLDMPTEKRDLLVTEKFREFGHVFSHPPDDLSAHIVACKIWNAQGLLGNYFKALEILLCHVGGDEIDKPPSLYSMMHYRPGLFKIAALFVMLHYEDSGLPWGKTAIIMKSPKELDWRYGPLPKVEAVPYDCVIILWNEDYKGVVGPHGDKLNPLRWCDDSFFPRWGTIPPEGWWTWHKKGDMQRPPEVKTWAEMYETPDQLAWDRHLKECEQCRTTDVEAMKQICNSKIKPSEIKDYTPEYCSIGQSLMQKAIT